MRLIDADFITKELGATCIAKRNERGNLIPLGSIDNIPTVNPLNVGKWENLQKVYTDASIGTCSCCGERVIVGNYCPNCGSDMREVDVE